MNNLLLLVLLAFAPVGTRSQGCHLLEKVLDLEAKLHAYGETVERLAEQVGFTVNSATSYVISTAPTKVKLNRVLYNAGSGYDVLTGDFTAPVAGMYSFFIKMETSPGKGPMALRGLKEGNYILYIYGSDKLTYQTPSDQVVVHMEKGECVWIRTERANTEIRTWTRFGGFLITPDM